MRICRAMITVQRLIVCLLSLAAVILIYTGTSVASTSKARPLRAAKGLSQPAVAQEARFPSLISTPRAAASQTAGFWLVASDGGIFSFGDAHFSDRPAAPAESAYGRHGRLPGHRLLAGGVRWRRVFLDARSLAPPDGTVSIGLSWEWPLRQTARAIGWWPRRRHLYLRRRRILWLHRRHRLNRPIVGMARPRPQGLLAGGLRGGIFTFGDAGYYGSTGPAWLNKPIVGMAATPTARATGWWPPTAAYSPSATPDTLARIRVKV